MTCDVDWEALVSAAVAEPPRPGCLALALSRFDQAFQRQHGHCPELNDHLPAVRWFLWRIANAEADLEAVAWGEKFEKEHGRYPVFEDVPRCFHRPPKKKMGRPKKALLRWINARRAWFRFFARRSFEIKREWLALAKGNEGWRCFGFDQLGMKDATPSDLALEIVADEFGISESYALDLIYPDRRKSKKIHNRK
nr:hypothetical protein [Zoogloeaceae bacterium]